MANAARRLLFCSLVSALGVVAAPRPDGDCSGIPLEGRMIRYVSLRTPFSSLPLLARLEQPLLKSLRQQLGPTYQTPLVNAATALLEGQQLAPAQNFGLPITASLATLSASNCTTENGRNLVDLAFFFIPGRIPTYFAYSRESRTEELTNMALPAGVAPAKFTVRPTFGYSQSSRLVSGLDATWQRPNVFLESVKLHAAGSPQLLDIGASLGGQQTLRASGLKLSAWQAGFAYRDEPVAANRFVTSQAFLNWKGTTPALGPLGVVLRYGAALEGGSKRAPVTLERSSFASAKLYSGLTLRTQHQTLAASYGLQASGWGSGGDTSFRKHLLDAAHTLSFSPNHYPIELDSRFTAGILENLCRTCAVPLADQFYAGNVEQNFLRDPSWVIRAQPFLRGLPLNALSTAAPERFWALNLTAAVAAWRFPLIPSFLLNEPTFLQRVDKLPDSVTALLASAYSKDDNSIGTDPALGPSRALLSPLTQQLTAAEDTWTSLEDTIPADLQEAYDICSDTRDSLLLDLSDIADGSQSIAALANSQSNLAATAACFTRFTPTLSALTQSMESFRVQLQQSLSRTTAYQRALKQATQDMLIARRTIRTLFHEANFASISPVAIFDAVDLRSSANVLRRYSTGAGLRFTLVSSVRFTVGYATNLHRLPREPRGAWFASLEILDLFGR